MRLSVIIPVFNGAHHLQNAVVSASEAGGDPEIIVVDDGSTDDTAAIVAGLTPDVRFDSQLRAGPSVARNRGLELANGDVIRFLDADDQFAPDSSAHLMSELAERPNADIVTGHCQGYGEVTNIDGTTATGVTGARLNFGIGTALFRRRALSRLGGYDPGLRFGEDLDLLLRAHEAGLTIEIIDEVTYYYRIHAASATYGKDIHEMQLLRILKGSLDRRRKAPVRDGG